MFNYYKQIGNTSPLELIILPNACMVFLIAPDVVSIGLPCAADVQVADRVQYATTQALTIWEKSFKTKWRHGIKTQLTFLQLYPPIIITLQTF